MRQVHGFRATVSRARPAGSQRTEAMELRAVRQLVPLVPHAAPVLLVDVEPRS